MTNKDIINQISKIKKSKLQTKDCKLKMKSLLSNMKSENNSNFKKSNNLIIKSNKKYNNHAIYNGIYYPIFTGFDNNFEDKSFPLRYDHQYSPLFNDENVYSVENSNHDTIYGNIWIFLTGYNHDYTDDNDDAMNGDFTTADNYARGIELFENERPDGYVWHHVFMGWFDYVNSAYFDDGLSTTDILNTEDVNFNRTERPFEYYYKNVGKIEVLDASTWSNCMNNNAYFWIPDAHLSLMQLVRKELILGSEYLDSCDQYIIYSDNIYGGYSGDYTDNDRERFKQD